MRVAMYEILYMQDIPNAAAINEAVEMTKHYEEPEVVSFVNGILAPLSGGSACPIRWAPSAAGPRRPRRRRRFPPGSPGRSRREHAHPGH